MGADEDAVGEFRLIAGDDVVGQERRAVEAFDGGALLRHLQAVVLKLTGYPLSALLVGLAVHSAWSEVALGLTEGIGRVGIKADGYGCRLLCLYG